MAVNEPRIFSPQSIALKDQMVAYKLLLSSVSKDYKEYAERFLFAEEMGKIWADFEQRNVHENIQFILFWNLHSSIRHWANYDKRSPGEKKRDLQDIVKAAKSLNKLLTKPHNLLMLIRHELPRSMKDVESKLAGEKVEGIKYQNEESMMSLCEELKSIESRGAGALRERAYNQTTISKIPKHKNRDTAFRNLLVDRMCTFFSDSYRKRPAGLTVKSIAKIATIISGYQTEEEDVKDRAKQLRKNSIIPKQKSSRSGKKLSK